jgi:hypothetical protein
MFDSADDSTGRAPAGDAAGQAPQNNNAMRLLALWAPQTRSATRRRWIFEYDNTIRRLMNISDSGRCANNMESQRERERERDNGGKESASRRRRRRRSVLSSLCSLFAKKNKQA